MNNPRCPVCRRPLGWAQTLRRVLAPGRSGSALWGLICPDCGADLKIPNGRVLLIFAAGVFFGSQTSVLLVLGRFDPWQEVMVKLLLILGFYALAIFFFLTLEEVT